MLDLKHKQLDTWKFALELVREVYLITESFPSKEIYGITSQLRRASVSVVSNISEGSSRKSNIERIRFYEISRSSIVEIDSQIEIAILLGFVTKNKIQNLEVLIGKLFKMITGMISANKKQ